MKKRGRNVEASRVRKVGFVKKFVHVARSSFCGLLYHSEQLAEFPEIMDVEVMEKALETLRISEMLCRKILERLASVFELESEVSVNRERIVFDVKNTVAAALQPFVRACERSAKKKLTIDLTHVPPDLRVIGDQSGFVEILTNVVGNAVKYTSFGVITIHVIWDSQESSVSWEEEEEEEEGESCSSQSVDSGVLLLTVSDPGCGLLREDVKELNRTIGAVSTNRNQKRSISVGSLEEKTDLGVMTLGIGLVVTKALLHHMNGTIHFESAGKGHGTLVQMSIPFKRDAVPAVLQPSESQKTEIIEDINLVIAEDDHMIRRILDRTLRPHCRSITLVKNGKLLVDHLCENYLDVSEMWNLVVISDLNMPVMDGRTAVATLRRIPRFSTIPIMALTGTVVDERDFCRMRGFDMLMTKPFLPQKLIWGIEDLWESNGLSRDPVVVPLNDGDQSATGVETKQFGSIMAEREAPETRALRLRQTMIMVSSQCLPQVVILAAMIWKRGFWASIFPFLCTCGVVEICIYLVDLKGWMSDIPGGYVAGSIIGYGTLLCAPGVAATGIPMIVAASYRVYLYMFDEKKAWIADAIAFGCICLGLINFVFFRHFLVTDVEWGSAIHVFHLCFPVMAWSMEFLEWGRPDQMERQAVLGSLQLLDAAVETSDLLIASVNHELGNHFDSIEWSLRTLRGEPLTSDGPSFDLPPEAKSHLQILQVCQSVVARSSRAMVEYFRIQVGKFYLVEHDHLNLRDFVREVIGICQREHFVVEFSSDEDSQFVLLNEVLENLIVKTDAKRLRGVMENLIMNAVIHGIDDRSKDRVFVEARILGFESEDRVRFQFSVRDEGPGMTEAEISRAFEDPFFTNFEAVDPTLNSGFHLFLHKKIAELMEGDLKLELAGEKGLIASFEAVFPVVISDTEFLEDKEEVEVDFSTKRVLIVDDIMTNCKILSYLLAQVGFRRRNITSITEFGEAIDLIEGDLLIKKPFHFSFFDLHLDLNHLGTELVDCAQEIGRVDFLGEICFATANCENSLELREFLGKDRTCGVLLKPICVEDVARTIAASLRINRRASRTTVM